MNNRFKFRMWDINTKRFYYMYLDELIGLTRTISIPKEATIQQYTGLTDSNDKEIYEGDILMYKSGSIPTTGVIGQVLYEADEGGYIFQWERKGPNQHHINLNCDVAFESVIVGNILENPELLK
jgi:uncharacterized phage protein (TIGR01671 family)